MTKEQLQNFRAMKEEQAQMARRLRVLERQPDDDKEPMRLLRECYARKLEELVAAQLSIERAIETLEPVERELVRLRYIDGLDWHVVANRIHYGWSQTHRIHARALEKLRDL